MVATGTTPTFTLKFPNDSSVDLTQAEHVYVTFIGSETIEKSDSELTIAEKQVEVYLDQSETLSLSSGFVSIQVNWTYSDGSRACSDIVKYSFSDNLIERVIE